MKKTAQLARQMIKAIGCANGLAGRQLGCENAVEVIKASPYFTNVQQRIPLEWGKIIEEVNTGRHASALSGVTQTCRQLAHETRQVIENKDELLVFGGDHSCAIGTWSGVATAMRPHGDIGLIWVDAHMDAHTPDTSDTGNIHGMPVAHLLGFGDKNLVRIGDRMPKLLPHNLCMVGIRDYESAEQELLERLGVRIFYANEVEKRGIQDVMQEAQYLVTRNTIGYGLSIDLDGFDVSYAPAVGTPSADGINALEFIKALLTIDLTKLIATEIVEFLPRFDDNQRTSEQLVSSLVEYIYKTKQFQINSVNEIAARVNNNFFKTFSFKMARLECKICTLEYKTNIAKLTPRILTKCGHTLCESCCEILSNQNETKDLICPFDRKMTKINRNVQELMKNFAITEYIDELSQTG
ncbi:Protein CBG14711, partial [Caenorhabditis briggsae]